MKIVRRLMLTTASLTLGLGIAASATAGWWGGGISHHNHHLHHQIHHLKHKQERKIARGELRAFGALISGHPRKAGVIANRTSRRAHHIQNRIDNKRSRIIHR